MKYVAIYLFASVEVAEFCFMSMKEFEAETYAQSEQLAGVGAPTGCCQIRLYRKYDQR